MWVVWRSCWGSVRRRQWGPQQWGRRWGEGGAHCGKEGQRRAPITGSPSASPAAAAVWRCPPPHSAVAPSRSAAPTVESYLRCTPFPGQLQRAEVAEGGKDSRSWGGRASHLRSGGAFKAREQRAVPSCGRASREMLRLLPKVGHSLACLTKESGFHHPSFKWQSPVRDMEDVLQRLRLPASSGCFGQWCSCLLRILKFLSSL